MGSLPVTKGGKGEREREGGPIASQKLQRRRHWMRCSSFSGQATERTRGEGEKEEEKKTDNCG